MRKLSKEEIEEWSTKQGGTWEIYEEEIRKTVHFQNFKEAMVFVNKVAEIAEEEQHHPDIMISYATVSLTLSTHDIHGISEKDLRLAEKIDEIVP